MRSEHGSGTRRKRQHSTSTLPLSSLRSGSSPPNVNVNVNGHSYVEITAPTTSQFYISGIAGGIDGYVLELFNATGQTGTFNNNDTTHETTPEPNLHFHRARR
jgi:hypothetical protein